ncbi:ChaN family lipoprotein [Nitrosomonas marina]|uniref:PDZ domain-containing protein n=1 Tax=Nitrosomonas marina TaxID=917 RepID=A0A1H8GXV2_9PROT|nr:ChaN family lipoprotein [Nitrosomonas marina]SEN48317.1 PDZ domain-containing protein [Nitrosomonas marina]
MKNDTTLTKKLATLGLLTYLACTITNAPANTADFSATSIKPANKPARTDCVPLGNWIIPGSGAAVYADIIDQAVKNSVVLLGETHVNADHHRWQLQMLAAMHALRPEMVIGFEMFPRRVQPVLDQWTAGELTEQEFLAASEWDKVWNTDPALYLPLFHFARMNHIPMIALNIEQRLRRLVSERGFHGVPVEEREGLTRPAEPSQAYLDFLLPIYQQHDRKDKKDGQIGYDDPDFKRFYAGQQLWDRAMAQALHQILSHPGYTKTPLVVGIMGSGHVVHGYGVPHQLRDLGIEDIVSLLPWDINKSCKQLVAGVADAVFGVLPHASGAFEQPKYQRLGIRFEMARGGALVLQVEKGSIAEASGLQSADVILEMAGMALETTDDVINIVKRHAPGTWLPLKIKRDDSEREIVAKFPPLTVP